MHWVELSGRCTQFTLSPCLDGNSEPGKRLDGRADMLAADVSFSGASSPKCWEIQDFHAASGPALKFHVVMLSLLLLLSKVFKTMIFVIYSTFLL